MLIYITLSICWGMWMINANNIDSKFSDWCGAYVDLLPASSKVTASCDQDFYDAAFIYGPWDADDKDALEDAQENWLDYCDISSTDDVDLISADSCIRVGNRWLVVYKLCFSTCLILTIGACCLTAGGWNYGARMAGSGFLGIA